MTEQVKAAKKKPSKPTQITKDMTFGDVLSKHPKAAEVFFNHGLHCIGCHFAFTETIEQGTKAHGMKDEKLKKMVEELNGKIKKKSN
ncbi:MAG: DUF1858 domain-containing protein [Nanoarchaeota archaeon]|nr:DUF1858 domain-containing protein [Nanoarchaeota archaeon]